MTGSSSLISKDVRVTLAPSRPRNRIWEIDFLRGACIILMVLDHLTMFLGMYFGPAWFGADMAGDGGAAFCRWCEAFHTSPERAVAHAVVIFILHLLPLQRTPRHSACRHRHAVYGRDLRRGEPL